MERNQSIAIVMIVIVIAGVGVTFFFTPQSTRPPIDSYTYETIGNPLHLDPHIAYDRGSGEIIDQCYETLYTYPWGSGERGGYPAVEPIVPLLAAGPPAITENGTVYTVELRQGVTFSDGTPFNASAAVWNFKRAMKLFRLIDYTIAKPIKAGMAVVEAAYTYGLTSDEFKAAFDEWDATDTVEATSTYEVTYRLEKAAAYFIPVMTNTVGCMISPTFAEKHASTPGAKYGVDYGEKFTYMYNHTCGTGPYQVVEWKTGEYVHMTLNEDYWRADATEAAIVPPSYAGSIKEIWRRTNENQTSMNLNLKTGIVDDTYWPSTNAEEIYNDITLGSKDPNIFFRTGGSEFMFIAFSFQMGVMNWKTETDVIETYSPFHWRELRKMVVHLLDFDAYIQSVTSGWAVKADGPIPAGMPYHNSSYWTEHYDPETAVEYWNEAMKDPDFVHVMNMIEGDIRLYYKIGDTLRAQVSLLLSDGFDVMKQLYEMNTTGIGYDVKVTPVALESAEFPTRGAPEWPDFLAMWFVGWIAEYADPDNFVTPFLHSGGLFAQERGYSNSVMDHLIMQGRAETDPVVRQQIYNQIQELAAYDQPYLWLYSPREFTTFRAWLKGIGLRYNPMSSYYYVYHVYKE